MSDHVTTEDEALVSRPVSQPFHPCRYRVVNYLVSAFGKPSLADLISCNCDNSGPRSIAALDFSISSSVWRSPVGGSRAAASW